MGRNTHSDSSKAHGKKLASDINYQIASSSEVGRLSLEDEGEGRVAAKSILVELADRVVDSQNGLKESGCNQFNIKSKCQCNSEQSSATPCANEMIHSSS